MHLITYDFDDAVNIVFAGDLHLGADFSFYDDVMAYLKRTEDYVVFLGDVIEGDLKDLEKHLFKFSNDLADFHSRVLAFVIGNHERKLFTKYNINIRGIFEERLGLPVIDPWGLLEINIKTFGTGGGTRKRWNYVFALHHGDDKNELINVINSCDAYVTAHTHQPMMQFIEQFTFDRRNKRIAPQAILNAKVGGFNYASYAQERLLRPSTPCILRTKLDNKIKKIEPELIVVR